VSDPTPVLSLQLTAEQLEALAQRTAELVMAQLRQPAPSPFLSIEEAADFLRTRRQRVDDLLSQGLLTRVKEGHRTLVARTDLEAYVRGQNRRARREGRAAA